MASKDPVDDECSPSLSLTSSNESGSAWESTPIWAGYQHLKGHFPNINATKENFFRLLAVQLPTENPEIQSCDGQYIDILWDNLVVSLTDSDALSVTSNGEFQYFDNCFDSIEYFEKYLSGI